MNGTELKLRNGDYVLSSLGRVETAEGFEEKLERVLFKLQCRKGGFAPKPEIGSELYKLLSEKKENRTAAAGKYVVEALEDEKELTLTGIDVEPVQDGLTVKLTLELSGVSEELQVHLSERG